MSLPPAVMVVDDEDELANLFNEILNASGFNSVSFTDPILALKHFYKNLDKYSLIITDLRMPGLNGIELAKEIRKVKKDVKIILITAFREYTSSENEDDFRKNMFSEVLEKPVHFKELRSIVKQLYDAELNT
ncbi:MAG TPA: response regulator [Candidatus Nitrosocosmicus sp.]|nr:response regulator [Candidatus Nitrosocosmicus sp.]